MLGDDGSSAVSLPEAPLLGVLPGTGGLTRLVDKRKIRRDLADVFSTVAEGVRGKRAVEWGLVDEAPGKKIRRRGEAPPRRDGRAQEAGHEGGEARAARHRAQVRDARARRGRAQGDSQRAAPDGAEPQTPEALAKAGACVGASAPSASSTTRSSICASTTRRRRRRAEDDGRRRAVLAVDAMLAKHKDDGLVREVTLLMRRVLKRLDVMAKSFFALVEPGSCFAGTLLELALAADRIYMLDDPTG